MLSCAMIMFYFEVDECDCFKRLEGYFSIRLLYLFWVAIGLCFSKASAHFLLRFQWIMDSVLANIRFGILRISMTSLVLGSS